MSEEFKNIIKVASIYMASIIGAGFASGQEIVQFFSSYYRGGFYGIIVAGALFALLGSFVLDKVYTARIRNYDEFLFPSVGYFFGWVMQTVVTLFMLTLFCIMLAGLGNILSDRLHIPFNYGVMIMAVICMVVILSEIRGVVFLSTVVSPILIAGIIIIGLYVLVSKDTSVFNPAGYVKGLTKNWFSSSVIYVSYNTIMSTIVLCNLLPYLKTRRTGIAAGILGGAILCLAAFILNTVIFVFYPYSISKELPVLGIVQKHSGILSIIYSLILFLAMFLSAVTSGYCFIDRVKSKLNFSPKLIALVLCIFSVPLAGFGFSNLISNLYPIFGYIGLFMVFVILLQGLKPHNFISGRSKRYRDTPF